VQHLQSRWIIFRHCAPGSMNWTWEYCDSSNCEDASSRTIGLHKQAVGIPVLDEARERQLLERLRRLNQGPYEWHDVERVFRLILEISRGLARTRAEAGGVDRSRRPSPRQVTGNQA
jgi:hypothetical protein